MSDNFTKVFKTKNNTPTPTSINNDSQGFLRSDISGDFNTSTLNNSGYGVLSAAEKNQTYFAYFDGVGGTGPEIIDQTAYFIKYLIDSQGNVVTPQANSFALLNLNQNFESGKTVNVTSLQGTTLYSILLGDKKITDVGKIETLLVTETSSLRTEFLPTMSFFQYNSFINQVNNPPNYSFKALKSGNATLSSTTTTVLPFEIATLNPLGDYNTSIYEYEFGSTTSNYGIEVKFKAGLAIKFNNITGDEYNNTGNWESDDILKLEIVKSSDNWATSQSLNLQILTNVPIANPQPNSLTLNSLENLLTATINSNGDEADNTTRYITFQTLPYVFTSGDKVRVQYYLGSSAVSPNITLFGTPSTAGGTFFSLETNYSNDLQITSSYWDGATYPTVGSNQSQWLTASLGLSGYLNNDMVQLTPTASFNFGFSTIYTPANLKPGDYIRFEYDPTKQSKIYNIGTLADGRTTLEIYPPIPTGSILDHFCVFRVIPNGNYIILNIKKPEGTTGQPLSGFIKPQYASQELEDNFENIIQKLAAEGTIS
jgi:hypothetical protein